MSRLIASVLGLGHLRPAPGTWGSLAAVLVGFLIARFGGAWPFLAATLLAIVLAFWSVADLISRLGEPGPHDPSWVVIDEVAGQWIALVPVVLGAANNGVAPERLWPGWIAAFLLFRLFDIWKPGPVGWADRRHGAAGVVLDDLFAGLLAALGVILLAGLAHGVLMR
ncbi:Phosphatidylglycerophosphatase A [Rubellimicrobium mesophilum DSM 19309]|uniref:Phosphatidylglycerophosphatase A n=1 Tax=Rubellimicrobium mesophilum DSM 19309 TaxID=442562 RepID=A0A017HGH0_9RHOB|nr:phosphatidylglycerophosphatase A [Rubellimicrobium mesophilum]EYD73557.1 Phosphatidylglycerophosphatase A [Rubellimicrobium mesophilum DSM 19309]